MGNSRKYFAIFVFYFYCNVFIDCNGVNPNNESQVEAKQITGKSQESEKASGVSSNEEAEKNNPVNQVFGQDVETTISNGVNNGESGGLRRTKCVFDLQKLAECTDNNPEDLKIEKRDDSSSDFYYGKGDYYTQNPKREGEKRCFKGIFVL